MKKFYVSSIHENQNNHRRFVPVAGWLLLCIGAVCFAGQSLRGQTVSSCGCMDVVFVQDTTGSMGSPINNVKAGLANIVNQAVIASGGDVRFGLVTFSNPGTIGADGVTVNQPFTTDTNTITLAINALFASGGNGIPESSDEALNYTVTGATPCTLATPLGDLGSYRSNCVKIAILDTDAQPGGCNDTYTPGVDDVNAANVATAAAAAGIKVSAIYNETTPIFSPTIIPIMQNYATITGGQYVQTPSDGSGTGAAIAGIINSCGGVITLTLDPPNATNDVGQTHTVTSCITSNGISLAGVSIAINVTGANTASGTCLSDSNGCCSFSYIGTAAGDDAINGSATVGSQTVGANATKTWVGPPQITCEVQFLTQTTNGFEQVVDNGCGTGALFGAPVGTQLFVGVQICAAAGNSGLVSNIIYDLTLDGAALGSGGVFPLAPGACAVPGSIGVGLGGFLCSNAGVHTFAATVTADAGGGTIASTSCSNTIECCSTCPTCETDTNGVPIVVVVNQNVTFNFNTGTPTFSGDPSLAPYISYDTSGPTPDTWKAIFNVGGKALLITSNATITTTTVPATSNNRRAPGIEIDSTCTLTVDEGSKILVQSENRNAGDILIQVDGNVTINGTVSNVVNGTRGRPGNITIGTSCGNIVTGPQGRIVTYGQDFGGSDINLAACESGNIVINGLVDASYKAAVASKINIAAFSGVVEIIGTNRFGTEVVAGTLRTITGGVSVRSRRDPLPGTIEIQALNDIVVRGSTLLSKNYPNYGAVAIKTASNSSKGGLIDVRSLGGNILAYDRAFDDANRFNAAARITLQAAAGIFLRVTTTVNDGASDNSKAVVSTQAGSTGKGGTNLLRAFNGDVSIGLGAQVLANFTGIPGANGANLLTACSSVINNGTVSPADADTSDDSGVCGGGPDPLFLDCSDLGL